MTTNEKTDKPMRIDTCTDFKRYVVEPDLKEFLGDRGDLRKAWHCAGSLFHLHDWVYTKHKASIDAKYRYIDDDGNIKPVLRAEHFANALGQTFPNFQLIRGIANAAKHFLLKPVPSGRSNPPGMPSSASNTYVSSASFDTATFDNSSFDVSQVKLQRDITDIDFADLAQSVFQMWNDLFEGEKW